MREIEIKLAKICGVAMAGVKPSCIVSLHKDTESHIEFLRKAFEDKKICFELLRKKDANNLIMVYRKDILQKHIFENENHNFLLEFGYPAEKCLAKYLEFLKKRLKQDEFPHEIGVFLGYPLDDVRGFINNRDGCCCVGLWMVYSQPEQRRKVFERYKKCSESIVQRLLSGRSLAQLFVN